MPNLIMHIDMDAFFASIEQRVNPGLRGKPVIVTGRDNKYKSVVCAASYEAKSFGIDSGMPSWQAVRLCPQARFVSADSSKYLYTSGKIFEILKSFTPQVEIHSVDEFYLNLDGYSKSFNSIERIGLKIKQQIQQSFGITCSIGVAPTKLTAKLATNMGKPDGLVILDKQKISRILEHLPVEKLCGIGKSLKHRLNILGIFTCGQLARYPQHLLVAHFGKIGIWLKKVSIGEDDDNIQYYEKNNSYPKSVGHSYTLNETISNIEVIKSWLYLLSEMVAQRLRKLNLQGKIVHVYIHNGESFRYSKQKAFSYPTYDGYQIYKRSLYIIKLLNIKQLKVRALGVRVSKLCKENQKYLFQDQERRDRLLYYLDKLNYKFGQWTIFPATLQKATI